jgi:tetratricopeptide (TPR) repeat protein
LPCGNSTRRPRPAKLPVGVARGTLPDDLAQVVALYEAITAEFPAQPCWAERARLAEQVRSYAGRVIPSREQAIEFTGLTGPEAWALDIAMPVIKANADAAAVSTVGKVVQPYSTGNVAESRRLAVELSEELVAAVPPTAQPWSSVMERHAHLLDEYARFLFEENIKSGNADRNATLSDVQESLLKTLQAHIERRAEYAGDALALLDSHLAPWRRHRHWTVVESVLVDLLPELPEVRRRMRELVVLRSRIQSVTVEQDRLIAAGLTVPRQLDPRLAGVLKRCYELQAGLDNLPSTLNEIRGVSNSIVNRYNALKYYDVAEAAVQVKAEKPVALADEYAGFQMAQLKDDHARREIAEALKKYGASENIELTAEFQAAIDAWTQLIANHPTSPLVPEAQSRVFAIGQVFQGYRAHAVAAKVYQRFAEFAGGVAVLSQSAPGELSTQQQAALAALAALDAEARKALSRSREDQDPDAAPPTEISAEFTTAIDACYAFIAEYPDSPAVKQALQRILNVALEYAKIDAWDVADGVYAGLLDSDLELRRVEQLKFARGLCQLGRAMPDHARNVLQALTSGGLGDRGLASGPGTLAWAGDAYRSGEGRDSQTYTDPALPGGGGGPPTRQPVATQAPNDVGAADEMNAPDGGFGLAGTIMPQSRPQADSDASRRDSQLLAMIRQQEANRAAQVANLRERIVFNESLSNGSFGRVVDGRSMNIAANQQQESQQILQQGQQVVLVLSEAELKRQQAAIDAAYAIFQGILEDYPLTRTAEQARAEVLVMIGHWRTLTEWERSVALAEKYLADNPKVVDLPKLRLEIARDQLAWAAKPLPGKATKQERLDAVSKGFEAARAELEKIVADFPDERGYQQQAQWDIANSYLKQARVVAAFSSVLARGQFVRTAKELTGVARKYPEHPQISSIPQMLWNVAAELETVGFDEEAILVWNELILYDPMNGLSQQASLKIAQTYHHKLQRPLKAAEAYQELNFARGGNDQGLQNAIFQIGSNLKNEKRWVESLLVLETFVDSFPRHSQAGQALAMVGQIHQENQAWQDAIAAYRRVINEFEDGQFVHDAKWAIAECTINLSRWPEAMAAYRDYVTAYPKDPKLAEANRRIEVLKDLIRYQGLVDEKGQRKAFDAQYQIAEIVKSRLNNSVKAIVEYRKVVTNWPESHLADDALYAVGATYLQLDETEKARKALREMAASYPVSPLADDALFLVGKSYEDEADQLATVTRATSLERNKEVTQRWAYEQAQSGRRAQSEMRGERIAKLKAAGKSAKAELEEAATAANYGQFNAANVRLFAQKAEQDVETLTATQLADREDKINAALRKAVEAYQATAQVATADKADEALLQMATIYDVRLKDSKAAMQAWLEIVRQFSGTTVAEDASWRIAQNYERTREYAKAIEAYKSFLRNYRRSPKAGAAQFAIAENYEHLGEWINAMDAYSNYRTNFPDGPLVDKAKEQINWIKTYRL